MRVNVMPEGEERILKTTKVFEETNFSLMNRGIRQVTKNHKEDLGWTILADGKDLLPDDLGFSEEYCSRLLNDIVDALDRGDSRFNIEFG